MNLYCWEWSASFDGMFVWVVRSDNCICIRCTGSCICNANDHYGDRVWGLYAISLLFGRDSVAANVLAYFYNITGAYISFGNLLSRCIVIF